MYKKLLTKELFKDNPYLENSVQRFIYSTLLYEGLEDLANEIVIKQGLLSDERLEYITREKEVIQIGQNPEMIFQLLRKNTEMVNRGLLMKKALEFEEDTIPWMVDRFFEMKKLYPGETYHQGPLPALHEHNNRFYKKEN